MRIPLVASALLLLGACGLDVVGTRQDAAQASSEAGAPGGTVSSISDAGVLDVGPTCNTSTCGLTVAPGWSLVTTTNDTTACPSGFSTTDVVENPAAPPAACSCGCTAAGTPSCTSAGVLGTKYDSSGSASCDKTTNAQDAVPDGACHTCNMAPGSHELFPVPPMSGSATCTATTTANKAAITSSKVRICAAPSCADACGTGAFRTCLLATGDQACPADAPDKHLVGTDANVTCPDCSCTATPTTCSGNWTLYTDSACSAGKLLASLAAGVCTATSSTSVFSYKWTPSAATPSCAPVPKPGVASLVGTSTLCCK